MARPGRNTPLNRFSSTELAIGANLPTRTFALLKEASIAPDPVNLAHGKGSHALYDSEGLEHAGVIAGFWAAGMPAFLAARLASAFYNEWRLCGYTGLDKLSRLNFFWRKAARDNSSFLSDVTDTFTLHRALRTRTNVYKANSSLNEDMVVEIVDLRYVFDPSRADNKIPIHSPVSGSVWATPAFRIVSGWERGEDVIISSIADEVPNFDFSADERSAAIYKAIETEFLNARQNAVGLLRVNVSLAVRNAFDAVHEYREQGTKRRSWFTSAVDASCRYAGVDDTGLPLDHDDPRNLRLSPPDRARHQVEIEQYIVARDRPGSNDKKHG
jgi:hypothetical protein